MCFRFALNRPDLIAAIATVMAAMPIELEAEHPQGKPIPIMIMAGTKDPLVPWKGGYISFLGRKLGKVMSMAEMIQFWTSRNSCSPMPATLALPDNSPQDGTQVFRSTYRSTKKAPVHVFQIEGGGHTWPGGYQYLPAFLIGKTSRDFDAGEAIWEFFRHHHLSPRNND